MRAVPFAAAAAVFTFVLATPAGAADNWVSPATIDPGGGIQPAVAMNPDGDAVAAWMGGGYAGVRASTAAPHGRFGTPVQLEGAEHRNTGPQVAIGDDGTSAIAWRVTDGTLKVATIAPDGTSAAPQTVTEPGRSMLTSPFCWDVAVGPDGTALAVWAEAPTGQETPGGGGGRLVRAAWRPPGGQFGTPVTVAALPDNELAAVQATVDGQGRGTIVWRSFDPASQVIYSAVGTAANGFGAPAPIASAPTGLIGPFAMAANSSGEIVVGIGGGPFDSLGVVERSAAGTWSPGHTLRGDGPGAANYPAAAVAPDGAAALSWEDGSDIQFSHRPAAGAFGTPIKVEDPAEESGARAAVPGIDSKGRVIVTWGLDPGSSGYEPIRTRRWTPGGSLEPIFRISGPDRTSNVSPAIAFDAHGNGVVVWEGGDVPEPGHPADGVRPIKQAFYDAAPPIVQYLENPTAGKRRVRFKLSEPARVKTTVSRRERCRSGKRSCVRYVRVDAMLTRGKTGTNALSLPRKALKAKGTYKVTLLASDRAGNRKERAVKVRVR